jgi:hypothetical protein
MPGNSETPEQSPVGKGPWVFPGPHAAPAQENFEPDDEWVVLCTVPVADAREICERLESEGIPCEATEASAEATIETSEGDVEQSNVVVHAEDLELAQDALQSPSIADEVEDVESDEDREKRFLAAWKCPKCGRQNLQLLPLSEGWRQVRVGCFIVVLVPIVISVLAWTMPTREVKRALDGLPDWWPFGWILIVGGLALALSRAHRGKRCNECGWESSRRKS